MEEQSARKISKSFLQQPSPLSFKLRRLNLTESQYLPVPNTQLLLNPSITPQSHSSLVSFNKDYNPYTPAFIGSIGKQEVSVRECDFKILFEAEIMKKKEYRAKVNSQYNKKPNLIKPEPNSKYCLVCKETFSNYFTHINHPIHLKRIAESQATQYIQELAQFVNTRNKKEKRQNALRNQNSKQSECLSQTSLSKELIEMPSSSLFQSAREQLSCKTKKQ